MQLPTVYERGGSHYRAWYNKAMDLHAAAAVIWDAIETENSVLKTKYQLRHDFSFNTALSSVFALNAGLSLELIFKACWLLTTGHSFKDAPKKGHPLMELAVNIGFYPTINHNELTLLKILEELLRLNTTQKRSH